MRFLVEKEIAFFQRNSRQFSCGLQKFGELYAPLKFNLE